LKYNINNTIHNKYTTLMSEMTVANTTMENTANTIQTQTKRRLIDIVKRISISIISIVLTTTIAKRLSYPKS